MYRFLHFFLFLAFTSITLTFDDNLSGIQDFDEVIVPEPEWAQSLVVGVIGLAVLARSRRATSPLSSWIHR